MSQITITFTGEPSDVRADMLAFLGITSRPWTADDAVDRDRMDNANVAFDPAHPDKGDFGQIENPAWADIASLPGEIVEPEATQEAVQRDEPAEAPKPKRTRRASVRPPVAETEAIAAPVEAAAPASVVNGHDEEAQKAKTSEVAQLMAVKNRAMSALQDAFAAGKVAQCRDLLNKYGEGAKSFRELDLPQFVDLDKAIQGGALA
jgi:hypothetical protein